MIKTNLRNLIVRLFSLGTVVFAATAIAADPEPAESPINGTWTWTFTMPDGSIAKPQATLQLQGPDLVGTCRFRIGTEIAIQEGKFVGDEVSFQVTRERNSEKVVTRYRGKISGGRIRGAIESNWSGEFQAYAWDAINITTSIEGTWEWPNGDKKRSVELRKDGKELKGRLIMEDGADFQLRHGSFDKGAFSFEVEREREGRPYTNIFRGSLEENVIKGKIDRIFDGQTNSNAWEAKRAK